MTSSGNPNFEQMKRALEAPGMPILRRKRGFKLSLSNSMQPFSAPSAEKAYSLSAE